MTLSTVSTLSLARQTRNNVRVTQTEMQTLQQELSTGRKIDVAGSLGSRAAALLDLRNVRSEIDQFQTAMSSQAARMTAMQDAMSAMREATTKVRDLALTASGGGSDTTNAVIDDAAKDALRTVTNMLNGSMSGRFLFGGTRFDRTPIQAADQAAPSGLSPNAAIQQVLTAAGPLNSAAAVDAMIDGPNGLSALFNDTRVPAAGNFSNTFFHGSTDPVVARAEGSVTVTYGATAGDQAVRDLLKGLHLLSAVPAESIPDAAYQRLAERAWSMVGNAMEQLTETQSILGLEEQTIGRMQDRLEVEQTLVSTQIVKLEEADPYDATLRLDVLRNQLEATFAVTSSLGKLSLANYL
ncbi:flagellin [Niveispirillum sp. KHB5.9]|uniref:flagellin N-terminal helical domain-containing protein n=1 Tax=Niveispirillum sp. KHB5.9 TaxID=3400269 RepID=UPI003A8AAEF1